MKKHIHPCRKVKCLDLKLRFVEISGSWLAMLALWSTFNVLWAKQGKKYIQLEVISSPGIFWARTSGSSLAVWILIAPRNTRHWCDATWFHRTVVGSYFAGIDHSWNLAVLGNDHHLRMTSPRIRINSTLGLKWHIPKTPTRFGQKHHAASVVHRRNARRESVILRPPQKFRQPETKPRVCHWAMAMDISIISIYPSQWFSKSTIHEWFFWIKPSRSWGSWPTSAWSEKKFSSSSAVLEELALTYSASFQLRQSWSNSSKEFGRTFSFFSSYTSFPAYKG